jgi:hypothetical protein
MISGKIDKVLKLGALLLDDFRVLLFLSTDSLHRVDDEEALWDICASMSGEPVVGED